MKLEIYDETPEPDEEKIVRLRLLSGECKNEAVRVVAVDKNGYRVSCGSLIIFKCNGEVTLSSSIDPSLGFRLDSQRCLDVREGI